MTGPITVCPRWYKDRPLFILPVPVPMDPNFNLRHEPAMIVRNTGRNQTYVNVLEVHGQFDPINEFSTYAYASVKKIRLIRQDALYTTGNYVG